MVEFSGAKPFALIMKIRPCSIALLLYAVSPNPDASPTLAGAWPGWWTCLQRAKTRRSETRVGARRAKPDH
ncbi:hypothetical protein F751_3580 [Auxenochlorella protothecoides]|uniref:Uncharacterized protein n=1 Tax=Auxenochlorella protothecoides TaxID=3075 RepID=A0A087SSP6_AUXPR|nr:hypothetical protein F751_3580 [Auxenochlorella protothecoides]KFM28750.1 hypothetical protein F751_3580 [Auxenochlorella protothecoides]